MNLLDKITKQYEDVEYVIPSLSKEERRQMLLVVNYWYCCETPDIFQDEDGRDLEEVVEQEIADNTYPYNEGDDYWTIYNGQVIWSCWDEESEVMHDADPTKKYEYFDTQEDAEMFLKKYVEQ